jgi:nitronate monooxygenase
MSEAEVYRQRKRVCDLGYLREAYRDDGRKLGYRCAAEPVDTYVRKKGGDIQETVGRKCLCNALMANIGHGQRRAEGVDERPLITSGDELKNIRRFIGSDRSGYTAGEVIDYLLSAMPRLVPELSGRQQAAAT